MADYSLKVNLNDEEGNVEVLVREKNGDTFVVVDSATFGLAGVHADLADKVALYGLSKLLQDRSSSIPTGPEKLASMNEVFAQLASGKWEAERTRGAVVVSAEVEALAELRNVSVAAIQKTLKDFTKEQKDKIFANPSVVEKAKEIMARRENETAGVDLSEFAA